MSAKQTIAVRLPAGHSLSAAELTALQAACEELVGFSGCCGAGPTAQTKAMTDQGWQVKRRLTWVATAERERESEKALGETPGEALCRLCELVGLHNVEGCP